jgi:uracil-DNA glycosylase
MNSIDLATLDAEILTCIKCPLYKGRTQAVIGVGPMNPKVMFIAEAPGENEDKTGLPLVGQAGKNFASLLSEAGLKREDVYITNVVKCRPHIRNKNRKPSREEIAACKSYLMREIALVEPRLIVLMGATALNVFFQGANITKSRGQRLTMLSRSFFITFHPASIIYDSSKEKLIRADFKTLRDLVQ